MDIFHHGAVNGVTGSCHELLLDCGAAVLVDCGLFQGAETSGRVASGDGLDPSLQIDFPVAHIAALFVTHVHIDHVGRIPSLLAAGFGGPIYCSAPTAILLPLVLADAVKIGFTRNKQLVNKFIKVLEQRIKPVPYGVWVDVPLPVTSVESASESLAVRFNPAGHILGSAYVTCRVDGVAGREDVVFSGDLGAPYAPLLPAVKSPYGCDRLVIESTYGDRLHESRRQRKQRLLSVLQRSLGDGGVVLIPAFSIGRTQEILYELEALIHDNAHKKVTGRFDWQDIEIVVDSPLAAKFTGVYRQLKPFWDAEGLRRVVRGRKPLSFENLTTIDSHRDHLATVAYLQKHSRPVVVIAASGMCSGGRIVNYLKALLSDARTDVLLVGYQARGTAGHDIQRFGPSGGYVFLDGERIDIKAGVHTLSGYSAHADSDNLVNFVKRMRKRPKQIRIVHGSERAKGALRKRLLGLVPEADVVIP